MSRAASGKFRQKEGDRMKFDIKVYDNHGEEQETIRDLTDSQATAIAAVFDRHGIKHLVKNVSGNV